MKNLLISFIALFLLNSSAVEAQDVSKFQPEKIYWVAGNDTISIKMALNGIAMPEKLILVAEFENKAELDAEKFEFKWYRRGATRNYLTNSFLREIKLPELPDEGIQIQSERNNLKQGWWKVEIESVNDRKSLFFKGKNVFWILIR